MIVKLVTATVLATLVAAPAFAGVNGRQVHQQVRILKGVANGSLTLGEFAKLERREALIRREERIMRTMHGGTLTPLDRFVLNRRLDAASGAIWRKKHN